MDYKQKYEEAIEQAKKELQTCGSLDCDAARQIFRFFPELKESEDERIRKELIEYFKHYSGGDNVSVRFLKWIAWLEKKGNLVEYYEDKLDRCACDNFNKGYKKALKKQGEQSNWKPSKDEMDALYRLAYITNKMDDRKDDAITKLYHDLKREFFNGVTYENMFPSSPVDSVNKVEPKFKVGDWVVVCNEILRQIEKVTPLLDNHFRYWTTVGTYFDDGADVHLWTIQDAKDGDVLVASDDSIFLFAGIINYVCKYYVALTNNNDIKINKSQCGYWETTKAVHPATKEQCDLLFSKMKEAGYEWNVDKKELKKIEYNPIFSVGDCIKNTKTGDKVVIEQLDVERQVYYHVSYDGAAVNHSDLPFSQQDEWELIGRKNIEQKSVWSKEDEKYYESAIWHINNSVHNGLSGNGSVIINWLKLLKEKMKGK